MCDVGKRCGRHGLRTSVAGSIRTRADLRSTAGCPGCSCGAKHWTSTDHAGCACCYATTCDHVRVFALGGPRFRALLSRRSSTFAAEAKKDAEIRAVFLCSCHHMFTLVRGITIMYPLKRSYVLQVEPGKPGAEVSKKKYKSKKKFAYRMCTG